MPEGHTIHALAARLNAAFAGSPVAVSSPQGRFADGARALGNATFVEAEAWGKHLLIDIEQRPPVHVHLGLFGRFSVTRRRGAGAPPVTGQVRMRLLSSSHVGDLRGPAACELMAPQAWESLLARLGPDPLRDDADPEHGWIAIHRSRRPVGQLLMDQSVIAGIGNVYRAELLHRIGVSPRLAGRDLPREAYDALWRDLVRLMPLGVATGRILTRDPDIARVVTASGALPPFRPAHAVYRRAGQACRDCRDLVMGSVEAGRTLYWCPTCQPTP